MNDNMPIEQIEDGEFYKGYSKFADVKDRTLRSFNQYNILSTMHENKLDELGLGYIASLPQEDRIGLSIITTYIKQKGLEETRREIINSMVA